MMLTLGLMPLALLALGFPFFLVLLATAAVVVAGFGSMPATVLHQVMFSSIDKFALLAVPFFIFAGDLMGRGGVSRRLIRFVTAAMGSVRGAVPFTALGTTVAFSAVSGSTAATVASVGSLTYDRMVADGYSTRFASGLIVSSGAIGNLIPPSIGFILYGIASDTSIVRLFAAGLVPGILLAAFFGAYIWWYTGRHDKKRGNPFSMRELWAATRDGIWALAAPVVVLGGIYAGLFSPTEAAGIACIYAIGVVGLVYKELTWRDIWQSASRSMYLTAQVLVIVAAAGVFSWLLTTNGVPQWLVSTVTGLDVPPWVILLSINLLLIMVGTALDTTSAILVLTPLLVPIARAIGVDPVHFGVIVVMNLSIGTFTPPFGINLFVGQAIFRIPLSEICRATLPFVVVAVAALMVVTYVPSLSLTILRFIG